MISIREKVFETNSSSAHVLTFSTEGSLKKPSPHCWTSLDFIGGSFQWEHRTYHDPQAKLSYWLNAYTSDRRNILCKENAIAKNVPSYYITDYLGEDDKEWGKTRGPSDLEVYKKVLQETADHLREVFKAFNEYNVELYCEPRREEFPYHDTLKGEQYVDKFLSINQPTRMSQLCDSWFEYFVDLGAGIDHQSAPGESSDCQALARLEPLKVVEWVLGDGCFETGNDNDEEYTWED